MSEDIIGPVELADFYLYPFVRLGARPGKILSWQTKPGNASYSITATHWMNCINGLKISSNAFLITSSSGPACRKARRLFC